MLTSEVPFEASDHGETRRREREISITDLRNAVKYGEKKRAKKDPLTGRCRWTFTHMGIVYVTDHSCRKEITSWALPLPLHKAIIDPRAKLPIAEARRRIAQNKNIVRSHTVIVVDQSGSMRESDMNGHESRSRAVYYNLAKEFIVPRLDSSAYDGELLMDVVTLIEMQDGPTVVFEYEPISLELYNRFVELSRMKNSNFNGNYGPSILLAMEYLMKSNNPQCALALYFLSDGKPSDRGGNPEQVICDYISEYCTILGSRLTFISQGFGSIDDDSFKVLQHMTQTAIDSGVTNSFFNRGGSNTLKTSLTSLITSTA
jgi:hypothetical protein